MKKYISIIYYTIKFILKLPFLAWIKTELINEIERQKEANIIKAINAEVNEVIVECPFCKIKTVIIIHGRLFQRYQACDKCEIEKFVDLKLQDRITIN